MTLFAIGLFLVVGIGRLALAIPERANTNDFAHFYASSRLLIEGQPVYQVPLEPLFAKYGFEYDPRITHATNPPLLVLFFAAFAWLPPASAYAAWVALEMISLAVVLTITIVLLRPDLSVRGAWALVALTLVSNALYDHVYFSQVQLLLGALIYLALFLLLRGKGTLAALLVTSAGALKLFPLVLLPWFLFAGAKYRQEIAQRTIACAALGLGLLLLTGFEPWLAFAEHGLPVISENVTDRFSNLSIPALVGNIGFACFGFEPTPTQAAFCYQLGTLAGLAAIAATYLATFRYGKNLMSQFSIVSIGMLVGGVTSWMHYYVLLIFPLAYAAVRLAQKPSRATGILYAVSLGVIVTMLTPVLPEEGSPWLAILLHYIPLYGVVIIMWLLLERSPRHVPQPNSWPSPEPLEHGKPA